MDLTKILKTRKHTERKSDIVKELTQHFGNYNPKIKTKLDNINKAGSTNSIPCTTKRVSQNSRIYLPYDIIIKNKLSLEELNTYSNGICIGITPSKFNELCKNDQNSKLDNHIINNIGSDENVSAIVVIMKISGYSGSNKERQEKLILDELIKKNNWKPIIRKTIIKKTDINKGNDKWEGHYYYNISGGQQESHKSWEEKEEQIFTTHKGFMSNNEVINMVKKSLIYMMLFVYDIDKVIDNNKVEEYKSTLENELKNKFYINKSCYQLIKQLECFDKDNNLISPIMCNKISIDDFGEIHKLNISHNVAVSKNIIQYCDINKIMLSDYRPGNLFWDFEIANMRQQDNTIEEYWVEIKKSIENREKNLSLS